MTAGTPRAQGGQDGGAARERVPYAGRARPPHDAEGRVPHKTGPHGDEPHAPPPPGTARDDLLIRIHDLAGRPRGVGFLADHQGTLLTSHEAVDGLPRLILRTAAEHSCVIAADAVTPLPELDLALVRTEGLGVDPLPVTVRDGVEPGTYVRIAAGCWREARVLGTTAVTYTATDRFHALDGALELAIGTAGRDALRPGGGAAGGPVLDAATGTVIGVLGTALQCGPRDAGFAVPLCPAPDGPLADLLARNAATVPAYGTDLNLGGVLELTATSVGSDGPPGLLTDVTPVERAGVVAEFTAFTEGPAAVLGLVGAPGSGRTTELAALAARRHHGPAPAPTLWLRGADLEDADVSVADAARRALNRAARILRASDPALPADLGDITPENLARLARTADRPLLLLLDGPEEMPPVLAHRLPEWTRGTAEWLRGTGTRLVVACRAEYWEEAGARFPRELLYGVGTRHGGPCATGGGGGRRTPCVHLDDLTQEEARRARARYHIPDHALTDRDARHPLTLRLLSEVRAALPAPLPRLDRDDVLSAHLDLMCLRVAVRLAAENGLRGTAVRRLAARVAGQVHEAARRSLGPGQGELDRESFEDVFPWGPAPARLGGGTGWASAVLTEGLLVPAGRGYRFAHEELADWIQGMHLDLDEALRALVHRRRTPHTAHPVPVPHHRIGPVVEALLLVARQQGPGRLADKLTELAHALDADPQSWWAARLFAETLTRVPDATPYTPVLRLLAETIVDWRRQGRPVPGEFAPAFWTALPLTHADRLDLLRRLVLADPAPHETGPALHRTSPLPHETGPLPHETGPLPHETGPAPHETDPARDRYLDAAARLLAADPTAVQPQLTRWFHDERPLPATPHATVATAAQALLHTHRHRALDDLTEALVDSAHRRGDELLAVLAEEEPSAVCRAVDRWAHDERPARRVAAVTYGLRAAPHIRTEADRELLSYAALALLARPTDRTLHGGALGLLVRDPRTRARHLPQALRHFTAGDPHLPPSALLAALATHPEPVLEAFRERLTEHSPLPETGAALRALADVTTPALAHRVAALLRDVIERRPETAADFAAYADRRLDQHPEARAVLLPLLTGLLDGGPEPVRARLAGVIAGPGPLRAELRAFLLDRERDPAVLDALLRAAAPHGGDGLRDLVHRVGLLLVRTPEGATRYDRALVDLGRHLPGFAARVTGWLADSPQEWSALVGPSTRRMIENLAGAAVPV
ncbi:trypsin-like peptidase domain-containing protein [Streptomyces sp. enrichment culture]|uniref:trypsin-like peptidase domain-containing protein n=1 Tax=Streptomyces sp. enrichment culture TaxID=1795815 RepID=UPI003F55CFA8